MGWEMKCLFCQRELANSFNHLCPVLLGDEPRPQTPEPYITSETITRELAEKATGIKHDSGKEPLDLIPSEALLQLARVLQYGATKYASHNWRGGLAWSRVYAAVMRHLLKWNAGQTVDEETGLNHLAHAMCGIAFLLEYAKTKPELDDRYKPEGGK